MEVKKVKKVKLFLSASSLNLYMGFVVFPHTRHNTVSVCFFCLWMFSLHSSQHIMSTCVYNIFLVYQTNTAFYRIVNIVIKYYVGFCYCPYKMFGDTGRRS